MTVISSSFKPFGLTHSDAQLSASSQQHHMHQSGSTGQLAGGYAGHAPAGNQDGRSWMASMQQQQQQQQAFAPQTPQALNLQQLMNSMSQPLPSANGNGATHPLTGHAMVYNTGLQQLQPQHNGGQQQQQQQPQMTLPEYSLLQQLHLQTSQLTQQQQQQQQQQQRPSGHPGSSSGLLGAMGGNGGGGGNNGNNAPSSAVMRPIVRTPKLGTVATYNPATGVRSSPMVSGAVSSATSGAMAAGLRQVSGSLPNPQQQQQPMTPAPQPSARPMYHLQDLSSGLLPPSAMSGSLPNPQQQQQGGGGGAGQGGFSAGAQNGGGGGGGQVVNVTLPDGTTTTAVLDQATLTRLLSTQANRSSAMNLTAAGGGGGAPNSSPLPVANVHLAHQQHAPAAAVATHMGMRHPLPQHLQPQSSRPASSGSSQGSGGGAPRHSGLPAALQAKYSAAAFDMMQQLEQQRMQLQVEARMLELEAHLQAQQAAQQVEDAAQAKLWGGGHGSGVSEVAVKAPPAQQQQQQYQQASVSPSGAASPPAGTPRLYAGQPPNARGEAAAANFENMLRGGSGARAPSDSGLLLGGGGGGHNFSAPLPLAVAAAASAGGGGRDADLGSILSCLGTELARHGISVESALSAGWLGALPPNDLTVLCAARAAEEHRMAIEASGSAALSTPLPMGSVGGEVRPASGGGGSRGPPGLFHTLSAAPSSFSSSSHLPSSASFSNSGRPSAAQAAAAEANTPFVLDPLDFADFVAVGSGGGSPEAIDLTCEIATAASGGGSVGGGGLSFSAQRLSPPSPDAKESSGARMSRDDLDAVRAAAAAGGGGGGSSLYQWAQGRAGGSGGGGGGPPGLLHQQLGGVAEEQQRAPSVGARFASLDLGVGFF